MKCEVAGRQWARRGFNPSVAMVFFKTYVAIGGVNDPPGVSRVPSHLELKFQRLYPCFRG